MTKVCKYGPVTCKVDLNKNLFHKILSRQTLDATTRLLFYQTIQR